MDGLMPMSFSLTEATARSIGRHVHEALLPDLTTIINQLTAVAADVDRLATTLSSLVVVSRTISQLGTVTDVGLKTYEINPTLLDHIEATRWAVAYLSYVQMEELLRLLKGMAGMLHSIDRGVQRIHDDLRELIDMLGHGIHIEGVIRFGIEAGTLSDLQAFIDGVVARLNTLDALILSLLPNLTEFLAVILAAAAIFATFSPEHMERAAQGLALLADFVERMAMALALLDANILALLPHLTAFVAVLGDLALKFAQLNEGQIEGIVTVFKSLGKFVVQLGEALKGLDPSVVAVVPSLTSLIDALGRLTETISKLSRFDQTKGVPKVLEALGGFMESLGKAIKGLNPEVVKAAPALNAVIDALGALATSLGNLKWFDQLVGVPRVLGALGTFMESLANALKGLNPEVLKAVPGLAELMKSLAGLAESIGKLTWFDQLIGVPRVLGSLADFLERLTGVLNKFDKEILKSLEPLAKFISSLGDLVKAIGGLKAWDQIVGVPVVLLALSMFLEKLVEIINKFNPAVLEALPGLAALIKSLADLVTAIGSLELMDLPLVIGVLLALVGFIWLLGKVLDGFSPAATAAAAALGQLIGAIADVFKTLGNMTGEQLFGVFLGLLMMSVFIGVLVLAVERLKPALQSLATILGAVRDILDAVGKAFGKLGGLFGSGGASTLLSALPGLLPQIGPLLPNAMQPGGPAAAANAQGLVPPGALPAGFMPNAVPAAPGAPAAPPPADAPVLPGAGAGAQAPSQSINLGGVSVTVTADKLEANAAQILSDQIVQAIQQKLMALLAEQGFRAGDRPAAA